MIVVNTSPFEEPKFSVMLALVSPRIDIWGPELWSSVRGELKFSDRPPAVVTMLKCR